MECSFCQRTFHKGEHLRRHERSHTGIKPHACKHCNRSFSRQDSLIRHEKLHTRDVTTGALTPDQATGKKPITTNISRLWHGTAAAPAYNSPPLSNASESEHHTIPTSHQYDGQETQAHSALPQDLLQSADLDFELIWPDSELLFQTLMSQDASLQWQIPLGILPFSSSIPLHTDTDNVTASSTSYATPTSLDERVSSIGPIPTGGNDQAVRDVRRMVATSSSSVNAAIDGTSINSVFLDESLHMFFVKFIPTFPVLHRATFMFRDCTHPLLLNAIAIGSLYLGPKASIAKGEALWRLAHAAVATSWQTLITHCGPYDACEGVQLVITALLGQIYGALSKNRSIRTTSQATRALSFSWARRCGIFDNTAHPNETVLASHLSGAEKDHQWRRWVGMEIQHRSLLALYVVDGLIAQMTGEPTSVRHAANQLPLPGNENAFKATTADEWMNCMQQAQQISPRTSFRSILNTLFSPHSSTTAFSASAFSLGVILEGIQSILSECGSDSDGIVGIPTRTEVKCALSRVHASIAQSTSMSAADRLETLLRWHGICLDAIMDTSTLCKDLCTRWNVDQHIWTSSTSQGQICGAPWAGTEDARRALLHAVAIQDIVETLPRGRAHAVHMPASLFAASTIYAAFALSEVVTVKIVDAVDWKMLMDDSSGNDFAVWDMKRYVKSDGTYFGSTRNMVYELNSMHKLMGCLKTQWGVACDMESVIEQWVTLCH
jgi:hypothetical protein